MPLSFGDGIALLDLIVAPTTRLLAHEDVGVDGVVCEWLLRGVAGDSACAPSFHFLWVLVVLLKFENGI